MSTRTPARLWLPCPCGANLASVTYQPDDPDGNGTGLVVTTRNVTGLYGEVHRDRPPERIAEARERAIVRSINANSIVNREDGAPGRPRRRRPDPNAPLPDDVWPEELTRYEWWHDCDGNAGARCVVTLQDLCEWWAAEFGTWPAPGQTAPPRGSVARATFAELPLDSG